MSARLASRWLDRQVVRKPEQGCVRQRGTDIQQRPEALALVSQIVARLHGVDLPMIQFMPGSQHEPPGPVAYEFASACIGWFGRTLLLSADDRLAEVYANDADQVLPDGMIPGLHHARQRLAGRSMMAFTRRMSESGGFDLIVADTPSPLTCAGTIDLAVACQGVVLTVAAGKTPLADLRRTVRLLQVAGVTVFGTVLWNARHVRTGDLARRRMP